MSLVWARLIGREVLEFRHFNAKPTVTYLYDLCNLSTTHGTMSFQGKSCPFNYPTRHSQLPYHLGHFHLFIPTSSNKHPLIEILGPSLLFSLVEDSFKPVTTTHIILGG
jgi:hypothetical protein